MNIGYNVKKAEELMNNIARQYEQMGIYTKEQWEGVYRTLQANWVGEDEQDFETKLAYRICILYDNAYNLAQSSIDTIAGLVDAWYQFQKNNTLDGAESAGKTGGFLGIGDNRYSINKPSIKRKNPENDGIVGPHLVQLSNDTNRGLKDASSKSIIQGAVDTFVAQIKAQTNNLFEEIQTNQAFFGDQTTTIKAYIGRVGEAIAEVTVAVKDMYNALDQLAGSSYTTAQSDIQNQFNEASSNVEQSLNDLGNTRWS